MMWAALGFPIGAIMMILGQTEVAAGAFPYADLVLQGGALGVLGMAVWHAYNNLVPELRKEIREDRTIYTEKLNSLAQGFQKTLDLMADRHERAEQRSADRFDGWETARHADSERLEEALKGLAINCAEARHAITRKAGS